VLKIYLAVFCLRLVVYLIHLNNTLVEQLLANASYDYCSAR